MKALRGTVTLKFEDQLAGKGREGIGYAQTDREHEKVAHLQFLCLGL